MPSIDLGKLVQASISKQIQENTEIQENVDSTVNLDSLDSSMTKKFQELNQESFGDVGIGNLFTKKGHKMGDSASLQAAEARRHTPVMSDSAKLQAAEKNANGSGLDDIKDKATELVGKAKSAIQDHPGLVGGVAAGAGLLGAGLAARKYLARKKK